MCSTTHSLRSNLIAAVLLLAAALALTRVRVGILEERRLARLGEE